MIDHIIEHDRCNLFAALGSGKTGSVLNALPALELFDEGPGLILAPKRVARDTWPKEVEKWSNLAGTEIISILGTPTQRFQALAKSAQWHTINYDNLPWLYEHMGQKNWRFRTIVSDECTRLRGHREKGQGGKRTNALAKVAHLPQVKRYIGLTGTPCPNGLHQLWGPMWFVDGGERLGRNFTAFKNRWFKPSEDGYGTVPFEHSQAQIETLIADVCLTVDPRDWVDIAEPIESDVVVYLPDRVMDQYREMEKRMFLELEHDFGTHEVEAVNAAARTNKCLQIASGFVYHEGGDGFTELHSAKLEALESILEEANGMPLLVSANFVQEQKIIRRHFPKAVGIDDVTPEEFATGRYPMMVCHPASAGHGIDGLQDATNILVDYSSGWDLEYDDQIMGRIAPIRQYQSGHDRPVHRYRIMAHGTADYLVSRRRKTKMTVQQTLLEAMKRKEQGLCPVQVN
jgi:SNF2 family DNA or RNA helicase